MVRSRRFIYFASFLVLVAAALLPVSFAAATSTEPTKVSGPDPLLPVCDPSLNIRDWESEPTLAANPTNPNNLVTAWIQDFFDAIVVAWSMDGGAHWSTVVPPQKFCTDFDVSTLQLEQYTTALDPWLSFGPDGTAYLSSVVSNSLDLNIGGAIVVNRSFDGGQTWSPPSVLDMVSDLEAFQEGHYIDGDHIAADPALPGHAYAVWDKGTASNAFHAFALTRTPFFSRTIDGGQTWSAPLSIYTPPPGQLPVGGQLLVLPDGALVFVIGQIPVFASISTLTGPTTLMAMRSEDHGTTWSPPTTIAVADQNHFVGAGAGVAADGTIHVAWQRTDPNGSSFSIVYSKSSDGGLSWQTPGLVVAESGSPVFGANGIPVAPSVAVTADGTLGIVFYDHRNDDPANNPPRMTDVWFRHSQDGGLDWQEDHVAGPFDQSTAPNNAFIGDYQGIAPIAGGFAATFTQTNQLNPPIIPPTIPGSPTINAQAPQNWTDIFFTELRP